MKKIKGIPSIMGKENKIKTNENEKKEEKSINLIDKISKCINESLIFGRKPRITYIIGNNGTGKSRLLRRISDNISAEGNGPSIVGCISNSLYDRYNFNSSGSVKYLGSRTTTNAVFLTAISRKIIELILDICISNKSSLERLENVFGIEFEFFMEISERKKSIEENIDRRKIKSGNFSDHMDHDDQKIIKNLSNERINFKRIKVDYLQTIKKYLSYNPPVMLYVVLKNEERILFENLSTGEQNRILTFTKIVYVAKERSLILIDEPEISLHLHWQMNFHGTLLNLMEKFDKYHVLVATHSPIIISEGAKLDNSNSQIFVIEQNANSLDDDTLSRSHGFDEIPSHERLILRDFDTAPYKTKSIDIEISETILGLKNNMKTIKDCIEYLRLIKDKEGVSLSDKENLDLAMNILQNNKDFFISEGQK